MMAWLTMARPLLFLFLAAALLWGFAAYSEHEYEKGYTAGHDQLKAQYDNQLAVAAAHARAEEGIRRTATENSHAQDLPRFTTHRGSGG